MSMKRHSVTVELAVGGTAEKPELPAEFRLFTAGTVRTTKGAFIFDAEAADSCMKRQADYGNDLAIDYGHAMLGAKWANDPALAGAAAGWFRPDLRNGELWATQVSWTPKAAGMLMAREYRYISPTFDVDEGGRVRSLLNCALTNIPATHNLNPLMASQDAEDTPEPKTMKVLLAALSLAADATEAQAVQALSAERATHAELLSLLDAKDGAEAKGKALALRQTAVELSAARARLVELEATQKRVELDALLEEGKKAGKVVPATEAWFRELAQKHGNDTVRGYLAAAPAVVPTATSAAQPPAQTAAVTLSAEEQTVAKLLRIKPEDFLKSKQAAGPIAAGFSKPSA